MDLNEIVGLAGVPVIVALVQASKVWVRDERCWPLLAVGWGLVLNLVAALALHTDLPTAAIYGAVAGLAAAGLYDVGKRGTLQVGQ